MLVLEAFISEPVLSLWTTVYKGLYLLFYRNGSGGRSTLCTMFICIIINLKTLSGKKRGQSVCNFNKNYRIRKRVHLGIIITFFNANIMIKIISRRGGSPTYCNSIILLTANTEACSHINLFAFSKQNCICNALVYHPRLVIKTAYLLVGWIIVKILSSLTLSADISGMLVASRDSTWNR